MVFELSVDAFLLALLGELLAHLGTEVSWLSLLDLGGVVCGVEHILFLDDRTEGRLYSDEASVLDNWFG